MNDFARYWWTMTVDFAYKQRTRFGAGAAIRNIKLRMSRKLIFVSGLLICFGCEIESGDLPAERVAGGPEAVGYLRRKLRQTPLEILAGAVLRFDHLLETGRQLFDAYDRFLAILADPASRNHLDKLEEDQYESDPVYNEARSVSRTYRKALLDLFFDQKSGLFDLTKNYGVF
jgi:hypothetical protein